MHKELLKNKQCSLYLIIAVIQYAESWCFCRLEESKLRSWYPVFILFNLQNKCYIMAQHQSKKMSSADQIAFARYQVYKKRLEAILKQKNPKKLSAVDTLLSKYRGREHAVYAKVCSKYGITPKPEWEPQGNPAKDTKTNSNNDSKDKDKLKLIKKQKPSKPTTSQKMKSKLQSQPKPSPKPKPQPPTKSNTSSQNNKMRNKLSALKNKRLPQNNNIKKTRQPPIRQPAKKSSPPKQKKIIVVKQEESEDDYEDDFEVKS